MRLVAKSWQVDCVKSDLMFSIQTVASTLGCMLLKIRRGEQFADMLLERAAVAALPGMCFGKVGKDYVRFSLLKSEDQLREAVRRVAAVLA